MKQFLNGLLNILTCFIAKNLKPGVQANVIILLFLSMAVIIGLGASLGGVMIYNRVALASDNLAVAVAFIRDQDRDNKNLNLRIDGTVQVLQAHENQIRDLNTREAYLEGRLAQRPADTEHHQSEHGRDQYPDSLPPQYKPR